MPYLLHITPRCPLVLALSAQALQAELKAAGRSLDYIFVSHTEPDHSGLIPAVLDVYPEAEVCGSKVCIAFLTNLTHR